MQEEPLSTRAGAAVDLLEELPPRRRVTVLADADVDGAAAAAILARCLHRVGRRFTLTLTRRRDERLVKLIQELSPSFLITADLGATLVPELAKLRLPAVILDHHEPRGDGDGDGFVHVNPHLVNEDGSSGASGAAVAYRFAEALLDHHGRQAWDLLPFALLGAWGDRYHGAGEKTGLHARLIDEAATTDAHRMTWRAWSPDAGEGVLLAETLGMNLDPVIPRVGGGPGDAAALLDGLGVRGDVPVKDLVDDERSRLVSWMAAALLEDKADPGLVSRLLSPHPAFASDMDAPIAGRSIPEVALRLDAATRQDKASTALAALLGSAEAWAQLEAGLAAYRQAVVGPVRLASEGTVRLGPAHLMRVERGSNAGPVADRLMAWTRLGAQPVVVMGPMQHALKLSLRARGGTQWRLDQIAEACARTVGGAGGGHRLAAGAVVPLDAEARVLERLTVAFEKAVGSPTGAETREART